MNHPALQSLHALLEMKKRRLPLTRSLRSREVLKRQIHCLRQQIAAVRSKHLL